MGKILTLCQSFVYFSIIIVSLQISGICYQPSINSLKHLFMESQAFPLTVISDPTSGDDVFYIVPH